MDLVAVFVAKAHNLVLYGGAVAGPRTIHPPAIHWSLLQVGLDECMRCCGGTCQVA